MPWRFMSDEQKRACVAVIEDDALARSALGRLLQASGFEPALFDSAETFIKSSSRGFLCLIVDVHLTGMSGIDLQHIPYKGSPPAIAGLLGGEVSLMFANVADIGSQIKSAKVKPLAVTTAKRAASLPEVPTMAEAGLPGFEIVSWFGLLAPAGTPAPIVKRLFDATAVVLQKPEVRQMLAREGTETAGSRSPEDFAAFLATEEKLWARIVKDSGAKLD